MWPRATKAASNGEQLLQLFQDAASGLMTCDTKGSVTLCSETAAAILGADAESVVGTPIMRWLVPLAVGEAAFAAGQWETAAIRTDGSMLPVELTISVAHLDGGEQRLLILRDISERKLVQERLAYLASFDSLTGLPNRALFRDRLERAMLRASRGGESVALMFLDLDHFKVINDSLGHDVGDRLLQHLAETLKGCLRAADSVARADDRFTVSRVGGDEFTVIAEGVTGADDAALIAQRILDAVEQPFSWEGQELHITASIGISVYPSDNTDLDGLIRHTDMAMYRAKALGRGAFSFYSDELSAEVAARLSLENNLRRAVERNEFELHYQPKARLSTGRITGVEALIRWRCPVDGVVSPGRFIGVLEDSGLILPVGAWAIRSALKELAGLDSAGLPPISMAINLSARQFRQPFLARHIADALSDAGVAPERLEIELTESLLMEDNDTTRSVLAALAEMGVRVAMDDFGTGHSSLSYLKRFAIDTLKIDRSFVRELPNDPEDQAIATAIVAMGRSLNMKVVAEGVENEAQAEFLNQLGCDEMQGYLLSRPMPSDLLLPWLKERLGPKPGPLASSDGPPTLIELTNLPGEWADPI